MNGTGLKHCRYAVTFDEYLVVCPICEGWVLLSGFLSLPFLMHYLADTTIRTDAVSEPLDTVETACKAKCFNGEDVTPYNVYLNRALP
jgi:hypothetical protein